MSKNKQPTFEEQMSQLELIAENLERSDIPLEEMISDYQKGMELANSLRQFLDKAELKIVEIGKAKEKIEKPSQDTLLDLGL
jgi:exodeoxyribonuclease VII small subunit